MKTTTRFTIVAVVALSAAAFASAAPRSKSPAQFRAHAPASPINMVCGECQLAPGEGAAMTSCKMGNTVTCASCRSKTKSASHGRPADRRAMREAVLVSPAGKECVFYAAASKS